jgi:hypothetical protein
MACRTRLTSPAQNTPSTASSPSSPLFERFDVSRIPETWKLLGFTLNLEPASVAFERCGTTVTIGTNGTARRLFNDLNEAYPSTPLRARPEFYRRNEREFVPLMGIPRPGSELKAGEEACREASRTVEPLERLERP